MTIAMFVLFSLLFFIAFKSWDRDCAEFRARAAVKALLTEHQGHDGQVILSKDAQEAAFRCRVERTAGVPFEEIPVIEDSLERLQEVILFAVKESHGDTYLIDFGKLCGDARFAVVDDRGYARPYVVSRPYVTRRPMTMAAPAKISKEDATAVDLFFADYKEQEEDEFFPMPSQRSQNRQQASCTKSAARGLHRVRSARGHKRVSGAAGRDARRRQRRKINQKLRWESAAYVEEPQGGYWGVEH